MNIHHWDFSLMFMFYKGFYKGFFFITEPVPLPLRRAARRWQWCLLATCGFARQHAERRDCRRLWVESCYCFYYGCCPVWLIWCWNLNFVAEAHVVNELRSLILGYSCSVWVYLCIYIIYKIMKHKCSVQIFMSHTAAQRTQMHSKGGWQFSFLSHSASNAPAPCTWARCRPARSSPRGGYSPRCPGHGPAAIKRPLGRTALGVADTAAEGACAGDSHRKPWVGW